MKLQEAKQIKQDVNRQKLKEMFPTATEAQIEYAVLNEVDFNKAADVVKGFGNTVKNVSKTAYKAAKPVVKKVGKKVIQKGAELGKKVATKGAELAKKGGKELKAFGKGTVAATKNMASAASDMATAAPDLAKAAIAQKQADTRAAQGSRLAGGTSQTKFQQATQRIGAGQGITGQVSQELAPHVKGLQAVLSDPMTRAKWKQLVAQAQKRMAK